MSEYLIQGDTLTDIANAIRSKLGTSDTMSPSDMAGLIESLGFQYATGTFTLQNSRYSYVGATIASVSGLSFTPKQVFVMLNSSPSFGGETSSKYYLFAAQGGLETTDLDVQVAANTGYIYVTGGKSAGYLVMLNVTTDGFDIVTTSTVLDGGGWTYSYIAIG